MLNIITLVVFSAVTLFFVSFIASNVSYAKRSIAIADKHCIIRAIGAIIVSVSVLVALWAQACYLFLFA